MRPALTLPQPLECLAPAENLATLLGQRGEVSGELVLPCHTDREDLVGFLPSRRPAEGWHAQGDASRILRVAHPMVFAHAKERFDEIGTDRHADMIEPKELGDFQLVHQIGVKLLAHKG